jgi:hypothetical protein
MIHQNDFYVSVLSKFFLAYFMSKSTFDEPPMRLMCGCVVGDFGEIDQECLPHSQGNFIH